MEIKQKKKKVNSNLPCIIIGEVAADGSTSWKSTSHVERCGPDAGLSNDPSVHTPRPVLFPESKEHQPHLAWRKQSEHLVYVEHGSGQ